MAAQGIHLLAPGVPEVREAVDHNDQRTLAQGDIVNFDAAGIGIVMFDAIPQIFWRRFFREQLRGAQQSDQYRGAKEVYSFHGGSPKMFIEHIRCVWTPSAGQISMSIMRP